MPERDPHTRGAAHADYAYTAPPDQYLPVAYPGPYAALPPLPSLPYPDATTASSHLFPAAPASHLGASSVPPYDPYASYSGYHQPQEQQQEVHHWFQNQPLEAAGGNPYPGGNGSGEDMTGRTRRSTSRQQEAQAPTPTISSTRSRRSTAAVSYAQYAADSDEEEDFKPKKGGRGDEDENEVMPTRNTSRRYQTQQQQQQELYDHAHNPYAVAEAQQAAHASNTGGFLENDLNLPPGDSSLKVTLKFGGGDADAAQYVQNGAGEAPAVAEEGNDDDAQGEEDVDAAGEGEENPAENGGNDAVGEEQHDEDEENQVGGRSLRPRRGRVVDSEESEDDFQPAAAARRVTTTTSSGRQTRRPAFYGESEDEEDNKPQRRGGLRRGGSRSGYHGDGVEQDEDYQAEDGEYGARRSTRQRDRSSKRTAQGRGNQRSTRSTRRGDRDHSFHGDSTDADTDEEMLDLADDDNDSLANEQGANGRRLRNKPRVNYYAPLTLEAPNKDKKDKGKRRQNGDDGNPFAGLPANMTGAQWAALYPEGGQPSDSSDDDAANMTSPRKAALFSGPGAALAGGGMLAGGGLDFGSGAPSNLGKVNSAAALADTDPLGVPTDISFDSVGGLGSHIQQLKEMVSLPLLYPEVFERFKITPPRGVLFHGPPGTGKTLLARALAASCSTEGRKISFFMRKGADCLSKWVGEAERQLRLLFDEARACQPSIIFFDEIDGLAPVRSSKQEQIHASIVSTLLALMDGMDGRGQVIVIGATNRPDAIDPALRRPGRFDREFYFPLPNVDARRKIIDIHTTGWNPPLEDTFKDELAKLTKGYGGADLRALCTEAALNAVQRTYPQIYKTNDRLLIKPEEISVTARDFVISQQNLIPSTARSTSSAAAPLPPQLVPLLSHALDNAKTALAKVLPPVKRVNVLEEAEFVEVDGGFEKEKMLQSFEQLRVFRPRLIVCGEPGMGQAYVGAAVLHHLEGFHVQTLDLATLVSDSTRTMEASCVQLFIEAKRHKPSILFIPSLVTWCASVGETVRSTIKGLLDGLDPSDPILLLAIVDGHFSDVPADVRSWFGFVKGNRVVIGKPTSDDRRAFFEDVFAGIARPPNEYPDGMPRRKRRLEKLPIAPPPPPRAPTAAEIQTQQQHDLRLLEYLKWRLGPVLSELKKRYKRFQRSLYKDWQSDDLEWRQEQLKAGETVTGLGTQPYHNVDLDTMASDLYKGYYYTPDDFLQDILRIQANAEVNKIMENDAEAPIRAGQMVNHVKVMLDQTFDAASRAECEKMAERLREKEKAVPRKDRRRGRNGELPGEEGIVAAAESAAAAGGAFKPRMSRTRDGDDDAEGEGGQADAADDQHVEVGEGAEAEGDANDSRGMKRDRVRSADEAEGEEDDDHASSSKKQRMDVDGPDHAHAQPAAVELANGQAVASTSTAALAPAALASNVIAQPSFASLLNPSASTNGAAVAPPMAVGSAPVDTATSALSGPLATLDAAHNPFLSDASASGSVSSTFLAQRTLSAHGGGSATSSRAATPTPAVNGTAADVANTQGSDANVDGAAEKDAERQPEPERSPTPMEATPPPPPPFVVPHEAVDSLRSLLVSGTDDLTVDQLEQLRAACFDTVWRGRADWDRSGVISELDELARDFVEEVRALAA
ncbi:hypothetical protein JCM10908_000727 [Rhodotorula pacifica]|uniref:uncharacterized protein n=1 Tax=Rhodotorula pacifica TaxID=1495444 RepID=UPI00317060FF